MNMKIFLSVLILIFSFQSLSNADDISEFEIEGISVGDSLLNYFSEKEIKANSVYDYYTHIKKNPGKFYTVDITNFDGNDFSILQFSIKKGDSKYKIYMVKVIIPFDDDMDGCLKKRNEIDMHLSEIFLSLEKDEFTRKLSNDSGNIMSITYWFERNDLIDIDCYDWSKESGYFDQLRIGATSKEFNDWLIEK